MISPSLIELYLGCARKAAFKYWGEDYGVERAPQGPAAELGSELHAFAEDYLNIGKQPDRLTLAGEMFIAGLPFLPPPGSGGVEGEFVMTVAGIDYTGKIDYRGPIPNFGCEEDPRGGYLVPRVVEDHKTSSNPKGYGLWSKEDREDRRGNKVKGFLTHPQSLIYAARDITEARKQGLPDSDRAHLRWLYFATKGKRWAAPSDAILTRTEIEEGFGKIVHPAARELVLLKKSRPNPLTLAPSPTECLKYGGCPYEGTHCILSDAEKLDSAFSAMETLKPRKIKEQKMDDLMSLLDNALGAKPAATAQGHVKAAPASTSQPASVGGPEIDLMNLLGGDQINPPEARSQVQPEREAATVPAPASAAPQSGARPVTGAASAASVKPPPASAPPAVSDLGRIVAIACAELGTALIKISTKL